MENNTNHVDEFLISRNTDENVVIDVSANKKLCDEYFNSYVRRCFCIFLGCAEDVAQYLLARIEVAVFYCSKDFCKCKNVGRVLKSCTNLSYTFL